MEVKVSDDKLRVDIVFDLNGPHVTPSTEAIAAFIIYAAKNLIPPFAEIQEKFTEMSTVHIPFPSAPCQKAQARCTRTPVFVFLIVTHLGCRLSYKSQNLIESTLDFKLNKKQLQIKLH